MSCSFVEFYFLEFNQGRIAQLVEQQPFKLMVGGSNPSAPTMYYLYILKSEVGNKIYIGSTNNIKRRLHEHNRGATQSTRRFKPWYLWYLEEYKTKTEAIKRERQLKKWKNRQRIESLVEKAHSSGGRAIPTF